MEQLRVVGQGAAAYEQHREGVNLISIHIHHVSQRAQPARVLLLKSRPCAPPWSRLTCFITCRSMYSNCQNWYLQASLL